MPVEQPPIPWPVARTLFATAAGPSIVSTILTDGVLMGESDVEIVTAPATHRALAEVRISVGYSHSCPKSAEMRFRADRLGNRPIRAPLHSKKRRDLFTFGNARLVHT